MLWQQTASSSKFVRNIQLASEALRETLQMRESSSQSGSRASTFFCVFVVKSFSSSGASPVWERRYNLCRVGHAQQSIYRIQTATTRHNPVRGITAPNGRCGVLQWVVTTGPSLAATTAARPRLFSAASLPRVNWPELIRLPGSAMCFPAALRNIRLNGLKNCCCIAGLKSRGKPVPIHLNIG